MLPERHPTYKHPKSGFAGLHSGLQSGPVRCALGAQGDDDNQIPTGGQIAPRPRGLAQFAGSVCLAAGRSSMRSTQAATRGGGVISISARNCTNGV